MRIVVFGWIILLLWGCSFHEPYPKIWEVKKANENCLWLEGSYTNAGVNFREEQTYQTLLSAYMFDSSQVEHSKVGMITFEHSENQNYLIKAISENNVKVAEITIPLYCNNGSLISKKDSGITGGEPGAMILGSKSEHFMLVESIDGNLLVNSESSVVGMLLLVVPIAGSSSSWSKFEKNRT